MDRNPVLEITSREQQFLACPETLTLVRIA